MTNLDPENQNKQAWIHAKMTVRAYARDTSNSSGR